MRITHLSSGGTAQVCHADSLQGLQQRCRIRSFDSRTPYSSVPWHQATAFGDSKVVIEQVNREWDRVKDTMDAYCAEIRKLEGHFEGIEFQHVPRNNNVAADVLSKLGSR
jgi:hypothetical protein